MYSLFCRRNCSFVSHLSAVVLVALVWSSPALCGQIHDAAANGDVEKVRALLQDDPGLIASRDDKGDTPLHRAAQNGHTDVAKWLLGNKAEIDAKNAIGQTPLHAAAFGGYRDLVELLLTNKADVNARSYRGYTALHLAASKGYIDVVEVLLAYGANVNAKSNLGVTPLQAAMAHKDVVKVLQEAGAHE